MLSLEMVLLSLHVQCFPLGYYKINVLNNSLYKYLQRYCFNQDFKICLFYFVI